MEVYLVWTLTIVLILIGLAGVVVPLLPGTTLILVAMIAHKLLLPGDISWAIIAWIGGIWLVSVIVDFAGVILGTRLFGGGKWGMAGAGGGAFIGMFFSLPMILLGTIVGAITAEKFIAKKSNRASLLAGAGAAFGFLISTVGRLICAVAMIALFLFAVWQTYQTF
ncbi:MAG: DUF456 family protein [Rariglobus sp.]|nr:DUF456 domain-containing protein [Rariglobus sp.]